MCKPVTEGGAGGKPMGDVVAREPELFAASVELKPPSGAYFAASMLVWPAIVSLPLLLSRHYSSIWDPYWTAFPRPASARTARPSPLGLSLGLAAVAVGMVATLIYRWLRRHALPARVAAAAAAAVTKPIGVGGAAMAAGAAATAVEAQRPGPIQAKGAPAYLFREGVATHLSQPEGFLLLGGYLCLYWLSGAMPTSYYAFEGGVQWHLVAAQLLLQDAVQYTMHRLEHEASAAFYQLSHKPHHRFTNPRIFDAFNGSAADTICMILIPLLVTSRLVRCNVWSYMAFGSLYANWLTLIHSEYPHAWDPAFRALGLGTAADHHVHHKLFRFNFGHTFLYWDWACGTYRHPRNVGVFNRGV